MLKLLKFETVQDVSEYSKIYLNSLLIPVNSIIVDYIGLIKIESLNKQGEKRQQIDSINKWWKQYENKENKKEIKKGT